MLLTTTVRAKGPRVESSTTSNADVRQNEAEMVKTIHNMISTARSPTTTPHSSFAGDGWHSGGSDRSAAASSKNFTGRSHFSASENGWTQAGPLDLRGTHVEALDGAMRSV